MGPPRFQQYGTLLEPALRKFIANGTSRSKIGQILQLDPKTVSRLICEIDIEGRFGKNKTTPQDAPKRKSTKYARVYKHITPALGGSKLPSPRRDWNKVDRVCIAQLKPLPTIILKESPPVRITFAELDRRIGKRNWLLKHLHLLPQTKAFIARTLENLEDFQLRRIRWAIRELELAGESVKAWQVLRKIGLSSTFHLELVNAELGQSPIIWDVAA